MSRILKPILYIIKQKKNQFNIGFLIAFALFQMGCETDSKNKYLVNQIGPLNAEVFITSDETLDVENILDSTFQTEFVPIQEGQLTSPQKIYWYKLDFANFDLSVPDIWQLGFQNYDEIKIYYQEDDKNSAQIREKTLYKRSDEFHFADNFLFKDQQLIQGNLLYARAKQTSKTLLLSDVVCRNAYTAYNNKAYYSSTELHLEIFYYIFIGGMALMIFYFLGIFFMYKDKLFLLYVLYILSLLLYLGFKAHYFHWQLIKFIPGFHSIFHDLIQVVVNIFYLLFASVFLRARTDFPKLFVAIRYMVRILIGIMVIQLFVMLSPRFEHFDLYIINFERYFVIAFSLVAYFHIIKNYKDPMVLFLLIGSFFYLAGGLSALIFKEVGFMMLGAAIEVFVFSLGMGYRVKKIEEEKKSIENEIVKVQLTALKAQMNPHFIFNSLNSIRAYVIASEVKKASGYLTKFAKLIRLILYYSSKDFISLKEELDALALYVELEQLRFRDDFGFEQKISPGVDLINWLVPPLILQPYFENAIIHGLAPKQGEKKLEFEISFFDSRLIFTIKDNGVGRNYSGKNQNSKNKEHKSMSMELTKRRIDLSEESNSVAENITITDLKDGDKPLGTKVVIKLPVKRISVI